MYINDDWISSSSLQTDAICLYPFLFFQTMDAFPDKYFFDSNIKSKLVSWKHSVCIDQMMMNENLFTYTPTLLHSFIQINRISLSPSLFWQSSLSFLTPPHSTFICKCPIKEYSIHVVVNEISCLIWKREKKRGKLVSLDMLTTTKTYPIENKKITWDRWWWWKEKRNQGYLIMIIEYISLSIHEVI